MLLLLSQLWKPVFFCRNFRNSHKINYAANGLKISTEDSVFTYFKLLSGNTRSHSFYRLCPQWKMTKRRKLPLLSAAHPQVPPTKGAELFNLALLLRSGPFFRRLKLPYFFQSQNLRSNFLPLKKAILPLWSKIHSL